MEGNGEQPATVEEPPQPEEPAKPQEKAETMDDKQQTQQEEPGIGIRRIYLVFGRKV